MDVSHVVRNLVSQATEDRIASMALPLFGAGVGGLTVEASLTAILDALDGASAAVPSPLLVEIVVRDASEFAQAEDVFSRHQERQAREAEEDRLAEDAIRQLLKG